MRSALAGVALIAACGGGSGVDIEIKVEDGVEFDAVELYIAYDHCKLADDRDCPGVGWPGVTTAPVDGKVFELADKLRVRSDVLKDGNGVLHLEAAPGFEDPVAIGVAALSGPAGQETVVGAWVIHSMHIPGENEQKWQFTLKKTTAASTDLAAPTELKYRASVWARETEPMPPEPNVTLADYAGCSVFQAWDGNAWTTEYFVPKDDTDCDGVPADCNPLWNHAPSAAAKCVTVDKELADPQPCTLGVARCTDETLASCSPLAPITCVPDAFCGCQSEAKTCIRDLVNMKAPPGIPSFECPFVMDLQASSKTGCAQAVNGEVLSFTVPIPCPTNLATPSGLRPYDNVFATNAQLLMLDTAKISIHAQSYNTTACAISLTWAPGTVAPSTDRPVFVAITTSAGRQIVFPVWLSFVAGDCTTPPTQCTPMTGPWGDAGQIGDAMMACAR